MEPGNKEQENLLRIKEILFGEELSDLDQKLKSIRETFEEQLKNQHADTNRQLQESIDQLKESIQKLQDQHNADYKSIKKTLSKQITELSRQSLSKKEMAKMLDYFSGKLRKGL